ncbi:alpha/beta hydrolase [Novosphingobium sp. 9]|uniref:alpha/beta hydrolase n=1 Tax=Novosphingobium sp. 9 TaxID=2025349 RepID=UPI0021B5844C|nr:alpha/beta hydrolase [Novosphingobium sp. 9]
MRYSFALLAFSALGTAPLGAVAAHAEVSVAHAEPQGPVIAYETLDLDADRIVPGGERMMLLSVGHPGGKAPGSAAYDSGLGAPNYDNPIAIPRGIARYGPFRVLDSRRAALVDVTDARSPAAFAAMVRDHPGLAEIDMIDCPGTEDDVANLRLGRMIRARGMATYVPRGGSVRSGGVELFLAGARRAADHGAEFAVHSWMDDSGREPADYPLTAPENRRYLDYYREMGMSRAEAVAFYAMTNSVRFDQARWFGAEQMAQWVMLTPAKGLNASVLRAPTLALAR